MNIKTRIRGATILNVLLMNNREEIIKGYTDPVTSREIINYFSGFSLDKEVSDQTLYNTIKDLKKDGYIDKIPIDKIPLTYQKGKQGPDSNYYAIKKDIKTLLKLTGYYYHFTVSPKYKYLLTLFYTSDYTQNLINSDLLKVYEKTSNIHFNPLEKEIIINTLKISDKSFYNVFYFYVNVIRRKEVLKNYKSPDHKKEILTFKMFENSLDKDNLKKEFINKLQLGIGEHINKNIEIKEKNLFLKESGYDMLIIDDSPPDFMIEYEVKIKLTPIKESDKMENINKAHINNKGEIIIKKRYINDLEF